MVLSSSTQRALQVTTKAYRPKLALASTSTTTESLPVFLCGKTDATLVTTKYSALGDIFSRGTSVHGYNNRVFNLRKSNVQILCILQSLVADHAHSAMSPWGWSWTQFWWRDADSFDMEPSQSPQKKMPNLQTATLQPLHMDGRIILHVCFGTLSVRV